MMDWQPNAGSKGGKPVFVSSDVYDAAGYRSNHPLGIPRLRTVHRICEAMGWFPEEGYLESPVASVENLGRLHDESYIDAIRQVSETGKATREMTERFHIGNMENPAFRGVFQRAATFQSLQGPLIEVLWLDG